MASDRTASVPAPTLLVHELRDGIETRKKGRKTWKERDATCNEAFSLPLFLVNIIYLIGRCVKRFLPSFPAFSQLG